MGGALISLLYVILAAIAVLKNTITLGSGLIIMVIAVFGFRIEYAIHKTRQSRQKDPRD